MVAHPIRQVRYLIISGLCQERIILIRPTGPSLLNAYFFPTFTSDVKDEEIQVSVLCLSSLTRCDPVCGWSRKRLSSVNGDSLHMDVFCPYSRYHVKKEEFPSY